MRRPIGLYLAEFGIGAAMRPAPASPVIAPGADAAAPRLSPPREAASLPPPSPVEAPDTEGSAAAVALAPEPTAPAVADIVAALEAEHAATLVEARQQWAAAEGAALA